MTRPTPARSSTAVAIYGFTGDYDRAIADYDEAIRLDPKAALAYNNRGDAWHTKAPCPCALRLRRGDPAQSAYHEGYGNRGAVSWAEARLRARDRGLQRADPIAPDVLAYLARGNAYRADEQLDRAEADYAR